MKKYIRPLSKSRIAPTQPFAIDIHSNVGEKEQYSNLQEFEDMSPLPTIKNIWGD